VTDSEARERASRITALYKGAMLEGPVLELVTNLVAMELIKVEQEMHYKIDIALDQVRKAQMEFGAFVKKWGKDGL
jgi:hypothetical protein